MVVLIDRRRGTGRGVAFFAAALLMTGLLPSLVFSKGIDDIPRCMAPWNAVDVALADCKAISQIDPDAPAVCRWVMFNAPRIIEVDEESRDVTRACLSYACNTALLHSAETYRPIAVTPVLYRVDLSQYAGHDQSTLKILLDTWDRIQDPQFYQETDERITVSCPLWMANGKYWEKVSIPVVIPQPYCDEQGQLTELIKLTGSQVPIVSAGQFMRSALNSDIDINGLYPEFRNIIRNPRKGTAEQTFLARANVSLDELGRRNSDQRAALFGTPTAGPRVVEYALSNVTRPTMGAVIAAITRDWFRGPIDADKHGWENLTDRPHDGTEIFIPTAAGGMEFGLFDGNGGFVRTAPPNLAWDKTVPNFHPILDGGPSSCIRCHWQTNPETTRLAIFQPAPNYILWMRDMRINGLQYDIFGQENRKGKLSDKELDRLVSLYNGQPNEAFAFAGRTYARFVMQATGEPFEIAARAMMGCHDEWLYEFVTPQRAMLTLGYQCESNKQASLAFNTMIPPAPLEPVRISLRRVWDEKAGRTPKMRIDDWLSIYSECAIKLKSWEQSLGAKENVEQVQKRD